MWYNLDDNRMAIKAVGYPPGKEVMPVEVKDALTLMIASSTFLIVLLTFIVKLIELYLNKKK